MNGIRPNWICFPRGKDTLREAYEFEVNFHNQLKAKILSAKIVTQIIRESKIAYENLLTDKQIEEEKNLIQLKHGTYLIPSIIN